MLCVSVTAPAWRDGVKVPSIGGHKARKSRVSVRVAAHVLSTRFVTGSEERPVKPGMPLALALAGTLKVVIEPP